MSSENGTVLVSNIPNTVQEGNLWYYFFQEENGGGEVSSIQYMQDTRCALVTFEEPEVAKGIVGMTHAIDGVQLKTLLLTDHEGYPDYLKDDMLIFKDENVEIENTSQEQPVSMETNDAMPAHVYNDNTQEGNKEIFSRVEVMFLQDTLEPYDNIETLIQHLSDETRVQIEQTGEGTFKMQGSLEQIIKAEKILRGRSSGEVGVTSSHPSVERKRSVTHKTYPEFDTTIPHVMQHTTERPVRGSRKQHTCKLMQVDDIVKLYLITCYKDELQSIQDQHGVLILYRGDEHIGFYPSASTGGYATEDAYRKFKTLYQNVEKSMSKAECELQAHHHHPLVSVVQLLKARFPRVMIEAGSKKVAFLGTAEDVYVVRKKFREYIELEESELNQRVKASLKEVDPFAEEPSHVGGEDYLPISKRTRLVGGGFIFDTTIPPGIRIRIYECDITQENVDIIVNATNDRLKHIGGVALAILRAAGTQIQTESDDHISRNGKLQVGEVVRTKPGKLKCKAILHVNGPRWKDTDPAQRKNVLLSAYTNILNSANRIAVKSIAIPTISAGIFGYPKDICAQISYQAISEFACSHPNTTLKDIRLVDRDGGTVRILGEYFRENIYRAPSRLTHGEKEAATDDCLICLGKIKDIKVLNCKHRFCSDCVEEALEHDTRCPICRVPQGKVTGNQPPGTMSVRCEPNTQLPGYENCGSIVLEYNIPSGIQGQEHPNPGRLYHGTCRRGYLPDNSEGREICDLLRQAFDNRLVFTIGTSHTTGTGDSVVWNDIHHKTSTHGGPTHYGYPDTGYLSRVKEELAAKGIK
ncbi:uncharacterized protein LOC144349241 [Saccoglossus kowalevskii]